MRFQAVPLSEATGKLLGHNVTGPDGRRVLRKGVRLSAEDVARLEALGRTSVYVAELEPGDIDEDAAATQIARAAAGGAGLRLSTAATGRVNIFADTLGVVRVDAQRLAAVNRHAGVTLATLRAHTAVREGRMVATLKIIPYGLSAETVAAAAAVGPVVALTPLLPRHVTMILSGSPGAQNRILRSFANALRPRIEALGSHLGAIDFVPLDSEEDEIALAAALQNHCTDRRSDLIVLAGETAIMDRRDIAPRAVERAGGAITCYGAPVDPGNLLLLGYLGAVPVLGAPGCARSPKENIVDLLLPRLLAGDRLTQDDIIQLGHGGLLEDVPERPLPRSRVSQDTP